MKNHVVAVFILGLLAAAPVCAQERPLPPHVTVTGEGQISVPPDTARYSSGVVTDAKAARDAAAANAKAMAGVLAAIKAAGIADKDVQTSDYSVSPVYSTPSVSAGQDRQTVTGFRVTNRVMLTIHDLDKVGGVIDATVAAGANIMGGVDFTVAEPSKLLDGARAEAVADARRKAELYAKAAGATLGRVLILTEEINGPQPRYQALARAAAMPATPIAAGEKTLGISVSATFELLR